ncbi:MAG: TlpA disulfide reductase family protein [Acidobacteriota bacterium]
MAIDTKTFVRAVGLWLMAVSAAFAVTFIGLTYAAGRLPSDILAPGEAPPGAGRAGRPAYPPPDFQLSSTDGRLISPEDFAGEAVVIDLWASWCGPCRIQARHFETLHEEYQGRDVNFLAINSRESEDVIFDYIEKTPFPYPVLMDPLGEVADRYRSSGLPTVMVIDRGGRVTFVRVGVTDVATLRREIETALAVPSSRTPSTV